MKILHYSLGFPPYRSGGLTKFCIDLMKQQNKDGHQVALMWPGRMRLVTKKVNIKNKGFCQGVESFEIINPLPISYDEGIADIEAFTMDAGKDMYEKFLEQYKPDVIHIHTLMGLHKSFLVVAKEKDIGTVFTAHDFFPICPKVTMFRHGETCKNVKSCSKCGICNTTALSIQKIRILQSSLYKRLKNISLVKKLRKQHRDNYLSERMADDNMKPVGTAEDFKKLRAHYYSMLQVVDIIHYNSSVTKSVYELVFTPLNNCVIPITHSDIVDRRRKKQFTKKSLRISYLGPGGGAKGFFFLRRHLINCGKNDRISA